MIFFLLSTLPSFLLPTSDIHFKCFDALLCSGYVCVNKEWVFGVSLGATSLILQEVLWLSESRRQFDILRVVFIELNPQSLGREDVSLTLMALPDVCPAPGLCCLLDFLALISNQMHLCAFPLPQAPGSKGLHLTTSGPHGQKLAHIFWDS